MAQHPEKIQWKKTVQHGLSASQFGMALGFCGRVVDYVDYLRNIVGTDLQFTGNAATNHGIATEPKSRALYELLTGSSVADGGFFCTTDMVLGCSPDGRIFSNSEAPGAVRVRIPFESKRRGPALASPRPPAGEPCRLLEIKSPFRALYDGSKPGYMPFGIPLQYLCQMQGQMAIAGCEECDFFVYLDQPACQVVAWRVRRSAEFWQWAEPKLRLVVEWVRDGPPASLNRAFEFEAFDFARIEVEPLVFPYDISANRPIRDAKRFPFFEARVNPYDEPAPAQGKTKASESGIHKPASSLLLTLSSPITRFLFQSDGEDKDDVLRCVVPSTSVSLFTVFGLNSNTLVPCRESPVKPLIIDLLKPTAFEDDCAVCSGPDGEFKVKFFQQALLTSLVPSAEADAEENCNSIEHLTSMHTSTEDRETSLSFTSSVQVIDVSQGVNVTLSD